MNKEYIYIDGKIIVRDENGISFQKEYTDNIEDILVQENVLETINKEIESLEEEREKHQIHKKNRFFPSFFCELFFYFLFIVAASFLVCSIEGSLQGDIHLYTSKVDTAFGSINNVFLHVIFGLFIFSPVVFFQQLSLYCNYKNRQKEEMGIESELNFLKKEFEKQSEILDNLKKNCQRKQKNLEYRTEKVNDFERLEELKCLFDLYYQIGYEQEKYLAYYQKEILEKKLGTHYEDTDLERIKDYIEEKEPVLTKKRKK